MLRRGAVRSIARRFSYPHLDEPGLGQTGIAFFKFKLTQSTPVEQSTSAISTKNPHVGFHRGWVNNSDAIGGRLASGQLRNGSSSRFFKVLERSTNLSLELGYSDEKEYRKSILNEIPRPFPKPEKSLSSFLPNYS